MIHIFYQKCSYHILGRLQMRLQQVDNNLNRYYFFYLEEESQQIQTRLLFHHWMGNYKTNLPAFQRTRFSLRQRLDSTQAQRQHCQFSPLLKDRSSPTRRENSNCYDLRICLPLSLIFSILLKRSIKNLQKYSICLRKSI